MDFAKLVPVPFHHVILKDKFWKPRVKTICEKTTWYCLKRCEDTGRIANFRRAAKLEKGGFQGIYFDDSDVYKVLEGVAYTLQNNKDTELERAADDVIDAICAAQQEDGYLFNFFVLTGLKKRWTDMGYHEAYCLGHMLEGAIAYFQSTGKDKWLRTAVRALEQMMSVIGPNKKHWVVGHQELELALMKLYSLTRNADYLEFAQWLVAERGHGHLHSASFDRQNFHEDYCQDDLPAERLSRVTGHAVRAMYYYSAIADIASATENESLAAALERLWHNVVPANLYITGGIGQDSSNEGFTRDWHLPNLTAYCETCASVGMALWNHRMNLLTGDGKYADLVETEIYNGILSGLSLDGVHFFYENPLSSAGKYQRSEWFGCSCCPTNLVRFLPSIGGYLLAVKGETVYVNQYIASRTRLNLANGPVTVDIDTSYPWNGRIAVRVPGAQFPVSLKLRIPGWCNGFALAVDGQPVSCEAVQGYLDVELPVGKEAVLTLEMPVRRVYADSRVKEDAGRVAIARGPMIYCAEEIDQAAGIPTEYFHVDFSIPKDSEIEASEYTDELGGIVPLSSGPVKLIPYYAWANHGKGGMAVWIRES